MKSGVYAITHIESRRQYIGATQDFERRFGGHRSELRRGCHHSRYLQNAWNKYGEPAFRFEVVELCEGEAVYQREQHYLDTLKPAFNIKPSAGKGWLGMRHTEESKAKIAHFHRTDPAARAKLARIHAAKRGIPRSKETREKIGNANRGRRPRPETIEKLRQHQREHPFRHSEEAKARISAANKGKRNSPDAIERMRAALTGRRLSFEHRQAVARALSGRTRSADVVERARAARKANCAARMALGLPGLVFNKRRRDAKLSQGQIDEIRSSYVPGGNRWHKPGPTIKELGQRYGVSYLTVWKVIERARAA